jgi:predicted ATPase/transcriptional regulator with XRE-family HTH domain
MLKTSVPLSNFASLGDLLKFLRRRVQLSQRELSIAVGYSESHLSRIENNERLLDRTSLLALFIPALHLENEPEIIERLLTLCAQNQTTPDTESVVTPLALSEPPIHPVKRNHLPAQLTSFIGRAEEVAEVNALLVDRQNRLVTLTGAGGCGKTRLALRIGEASAHTYAQGIWLVELAPLANPQLLVHRVAGAFQLNESTNQSLLSLLIDFLYPRQALLILDNCEHLVEAAAELASALLRACPHLQILATSRETLSLPGEVSFLVQPFALPPMQQGVHLSRAAVENYDAIRLFVERARSSLRSFALTDQNAQDVARICQRLDGIPLGIELAVVWLNVLSPEQIASRLEQNFDLLTENRRAVLPRHRTLRTMIEWSYNLLSPQEQQLLWRLSIFVGGWSLEAAEAVTTETASPAVLKLLNGLVNKSLVTVDHSTEDMLRYRLLEPIREYLRERLAESKEETQLRERHLGYFVSFAETAEPHLKSFEQMTWLARLDQEQENLRAALGWTLSRKKTEEGLRLVGALGHYWEMRFYLAEGSQWCAAMLAAANDHDASAYNPWRAKVLFTAGFLACYRFETERSQQHLTESLRLCQEAEDDAGAGAVLCFRAINHDRMHNAQQAISDYQEGLRYSQRAEDPWWIAETIH